MHLYDTITASPCCHKARQRYTRKVQTNIFLEKTMQKPSTKVQQNKTTAQGIHSSSKWEKLKNKKEVL